MLGIFQDGFYAFDAFQGDPHLFHIDYAVSSLPDQEDLLFKSLKEIIDHCKNHSLRHLGVDSDCLTDESHLKMFLKLFKILVETNPQLLKKDCFPRRISFVTQDPKKDEMIRAVLSES